MNWYELIIIGYLLGIGWESASFYYAVFAFRDNPFVGDFTVNAWKVFFNWLFWPVRVVAYVAYVIFGR